LESHGWERRVANRASTVAGSAHEGLFNVAQLTIMAGYHSSLVNASGNGPRRNWKTDHCGRSNCSNTIPLALLSWPTFRLARRHAAGRLQRAADLAAGSRQGRTSSTWPASDASHLRVVAPASGGAYHLRQLAARAQGLGHHATCLRPLAAGHRNSQGRGSPKYLRFLEPAIGLEPIDLLITNSKADHPGVSSLQFPSEDRRGSRPLRPRVAASFPRLGHQLGHQGNASPGAFNPEDFPVDSAGERLLIRPPVSACGQSISRLCARCASDCENDRLSDCGHHLLECDWFFLLARCDLRNRCCTRWPQVARGATGLSALSSNHRSGVSIPRTADGS
jgi:hypothetical protein